jgi:hypothetical protein
MQRVGAGRDAYDTYKLKIINIIQPSCRLSLTPRCPRRRLSAQDTGRGGSAQLSRIHIIFSFAVTAVSVTKSLNDTCHA